MRPAAFRQTATRTRAGARPHPSATRRQTPKANPAASAYVSDEERRQSPCAGRASGDQRPISPAKPTSAPTAPRHTMARAASSRARPANGRTAANAAAKAMMLAPRGRKSAPGPAVAVRMNHQSARRPRLLNTKMSRRSGGAVISAATRRTAAMTAMAAASACQKPPSRQPATAASTKTKLGTIHPFGASRALPPVRRPMESCSPSAVMGVPRLAGAQETVAPSVGPSSSAE